MVHTKLRLLQAAREVVGGTKELADRLDIPLRALERHLADAERMPDALLLRAIDVLLEERARRPRS